MPVNLAFSTLVALRPHAARIPSISHRPHRAVTNLTPFANASPAKQGNPVPVPTTPPKKTQAAPARRAPAIIAPVVPKPLLFDFAIEDRAQMRHHVVKAITNYIKDNDLQDPDNKRNVISDAKLQDLFNVETFTILQISSLLTPHVWKPEELGGRYIEEARLAEEEWLRNKQESGKSPKPKRSKAKDPNAADKPRKFQPVILSEELAAICRSKELTRPQVIQAIWAYIRTNNLKDAEGRIRCDLLLRKVFNSDSIDAKAIMRDIQPHLQKKA